MQNIVTYAVAGIMVFLGNKIGGSLGNAALGTVAGSIIAILFLIFRIRAELFMAFGSKTLKSGDIKKAFKYYDKAVNTKSLRLDYMIYYAYIALRYGQTEKCHELLDKIEGLKLTPALQADFNTTKGLYLWKSGDTEGAAEFLKSAHESSPNSKTYGQLGFMLLELGKYDEAKKFNQEAYDYNPDDPSIADNMAMCYYYFGENDKAIEIYKSIMSKGTKMPVIYYNYALCLEKAGKFDEAIDQLDSALQYKFSYLAAVSKEQVQSKFDELVQRKQQNI
ncbi:MAG: tetratricopeptide repeat protein [Bacillota bacterium]|nr:tetratricopeptide repeat protein [Bacillota bacterium]